MPEVLWTELHNIVREAVTKTIPKEKNARRQNNALQITEKRREAKGKGERERYPTECKERLESLLK